ncbi:TetR family transcriptional regulator [Jannaschia sp. R86511]|uniref:TetR/AcrR family transcriptional regulator n=1 Tax=Jannaschia sp. R86511 TaxID=3093853 RepID=UPI0036D2FB40
MSSRAPGRRGRRTDGSDTRAEIVAAAGEEFGEKGFHGASLRGIARRAGVDPALVHHYFDGKEDLFVAVVGLPARPADVVARVLAAGREGAAEQLVLTLLSVWGELAARRRLVALLAALTGSELTRRTLREFVLAQLLLPIAEGFGVDQPHRRASLVASQVVGLGVARYVVAIEPLAGAPVSQVVADVAPTVHRYLFDPLPEPTEPPPDVAPDG